MYYSNIGALGALLTTSLLLATPTLAADNQDKGQNRKTDGGYGFTIKTQSLPDFWVPSPNRPAQYVMQMKQKPGATANSARYIQALRNGGQVDGVYGSEEVDITDTGLVFATEVTVGGTNYEMVVDTGSADTWLAKPDFKCVKIGTADSQPQSACGLASTYTPSASFQALQDLNYYVQYTDGEELRGSFGLDTITVAGITVRNQQFALVDTAAWLGDTATSGLLGLAFPGATKSFSGTNYVANSPSTQKIYSPIFTSMYQRGHVSPLFSVALDRNAGGQLAIGGLPPVRFFPAFASSPFQLLTTSAASGQQGTGSSSAYTLYTITTGGFSYSNANASQWSYANAPNPFGEPSDHTQVQVVIDTATVNMFLPPDTADAVNSLFDPKPYYKANSGLYVIDCNAKAPTFGVKIGFETFFVNKVDMVVKLDDKCVSAIAATGKGGTSILGEAFLKNVLAVFDVGAQMMRFAARENY